jgi:hypothetical protein
VVFLKVKGKQVFAITLDSLSILLLNDKTDFEVRTKTKTKKLIADQFLNKILPSLQSRY